MDKINISLSEVATTASEIRRINANLDDTLAYVSKVMNDLNAVWISEGAQALMSKFIQFSKRFVLESETIESYANYLDFTVSTYDSLESTITANASNFE